MIMREEGQTKQSVETGVKGLEKVIGVIDSIHYM
jgi:hypothetical protein